MASADFKHSRRRTNSNALPIRNGHARRLSKLPPQPKSSHTSDEFLQPFLSPAFDPASFLNSALPPLSHRPAPPAPTPSASASASAPGPPPAMPLADLSAQAQTLLSQLNAQTTRLSATLTQLTDDILRSGSRLAYEVELLRGETLGLAETMNESLQGDIAKFVPGGLQEAAAKSEPAAAAAAAIDSDQLPTPGSAATAAPPTEVTTEGGGGAQDPEYIKQLQTLTLVRSRLDAVIKTFGDAMEFVFPPSELSVSSSFLSVSAPEPGSQQQQSSEEKGQQVLRQLREETAGLLQQGGPSGAGGGGGSGGSIEEEDGQGDAAVQGIERAARRVEELKELTRVWHGTAEEKGRARFIEGLAKMVEDRHRELMREMEQAAKKAESARPRKGSVTRDAAAANAAAAAAEESKAGLSGFGLINQLQRLRSGL